MVPPKRPVPPVVPLAAMRRRVAAVADPVAGCSVIYGREFMLVSTAVVADLGDRPGAAVAAWCIRPTAAAADPLGAVAVATEAVL